MKTLRTLTFISALQICGMVSAQDFSVGIRTSHLFDLWEGNLEQENGFMDVDMEGGHDKAGIDFVYGLAIQYDISRAFTLDLNAEFGKMTGGFQTQYYRSNVMLTSVGANFNLGRTEESTSWPFIRIGLGLGTYNSERLFTADDQVFSSTNGMALQNALGLGYSFKAGENLSIRFHTEGMVSHTDAWDGYDNGTGTDFMLRSGLALSYIIGGGGE